MTLGERISIFQNPVFIVGAGSLNFEITVSQ